MVETLAFFKSSFLRENLFLVTETCTLYINNKPFFPLLDKFRHTAQDVSTGFHNAEINMENKLRHGAQNIQLAADNTKQQFQVLRIFYKLKSPPK